MAGGHGEGLVLITLAHSWVSWYFFSMLMSSLPSWKKMLLEGPAKAQYFTSAAPHSMRGERVTGQHLEF